jgi:hypothetical protein
VLRQTNKLGLNYNNLLIYSFNAVENPERFIGNPAPAIL